MSRYYQHMASFRNEGQRQVIRLAEHIWGLKDSGTQYSIKWDIARKSRPYKCGSRRCDLCTSKKMAIALADERILLTKRSEIVSQCRHRSKFKCSLKARNNLRLSVTEQAAAHHVASQEQWVPIQKLDTTTLGMRCYTLCI